MKPKAPRVQARPKGTSITPPDHHQVESLRARLAELTDKNTTLKRSNAQLSAAAGKRSFLSEEVVGDIAFVAKRLRKDTPSTRKPTTAVKPTAHSPPDLIEHVDMGCKTNAGTDALLENEKENKKFAMKSVLQAVSLLGSGRNSHAGSGAGGIGDPFDDDDTADTILRKGFKSKYIDLAYFIKKCENEAELLVALKQAPNPLHFGQVLLVTTAFNDEKKEDTIIVPRDGKKRKR